MRMKAKKFLLNPAIFYMMSRYGTYLIQFINSLLIAVYLGPYYLGIWGFINLILSYLAQINLGIPYAVNIMVSINKSDREYSETIVANGFSMLLFLFVLIIAFFGTSFFVNLPIGSKYEFHKFIIPVVFVAILSHVNLYLSNVFRIYGQVFSIAFYQSIYPILLLSVIPFFKGYHLIWAMLSVHCLAVLISLVFFLWRTPVKLKIKLNWGVMKNIQDKGWALFLYNASFYLILLSTKSFISAGYSVKEFGYFTFSYSLANVVLLLLNSISFLIFPKMVNRFASFSNGKVYDVLCAVRTVYVSTSHLLIHAVIMLFPLFIYFFPHYKPAVEVFRITALTLVLITSAMGYQELLMARSKEKKIGAIAFAVLLLNIIFSYLFVYVLRIHFSMAIFATMISYFVYVFFMVMEGYKTLGKDLSFFVIVREVCSYQKSIPYILSLIFVLFNLSDIYFALPLLVYVLLNFKDFNLVIGFVKKVLRNPDFINI